MKHDAFSTKAIKNRNSEGGRSQITEGTGMSDSKYNSQGNTQKNIAHHGNSSAKSF